MIHYSTPDPKQRAQWLQDELQKKHPLFVWCVDAPNLIGQPYRVQCDLAVGTPGSNKTDVVRATMPIYHGLFEQHPELSKHVT